MADKRCRYCNGFMLNRFVARCYFLKINLCHKRGINAIILVSRATWTLFAKVVSKDTRAFMDIQIRILNKDCSTRNI